MKFSYKGRLKQSKVKQNKGIKFEQFMQYFKFKNIVFANFYQMNKKGILKNRLTEDQKDKNKQQILNRLEQNNNALAQRRKRKSLDDFYKEVKKNMEPITEQDQGKSEDYGNNCPIKQPHSQTISLKKQQLGNCDKKQISKTQTKQEKNLKKTQRTKSINKDKNEKQGNAKKQEAPVIQTQQIKQKKLTNEKLKKPQKNREEDDEQDSRGKFIHIDPEYNKDIKIIGQEFRLALQETLASQFPNKEQSLQQKYFQEQAMMLMNSYYVRLRQCCKYEIGKQRQQPVQKVIISLDQNIIKSNQIHESLLKKAKQRNRNIPVKPKRIKLNLNPQLNRQAKVICEGSNQLMSVGEIVQKVQESKPNYAQEISLIRYMENNIFQQSKKQREKFMEKN